MGQQARECLITGPESHGNTPSDTRVAGSPCSRHWPLGGAPSNMGISHVSPSGHTGVRLGHEPTTKDRCEADREATSTDEPSSPKPQRLARILRNRGNNPPNLLTGQLSRGPVRPDPEDGSRSVLHGLSSARPCRGIGTGDRLLGAILADVGPLDVSWSKKVGGEYTYMRDGGKGGRVASDRQVCGMAWNRVYLLASS